MYCIDHRVGWRTSPDGRLYVNKLHHFAIGKHTDSRALLTAIGILLERGFGKPPQTIEHTAARRTVGSD
jgi:hypothetical protein